MKPSPSYPFIRLDLRFHEANDACLYAYLAALPPRRRAERLRHLAQLGWLLSTGQVVPAPSSSSPTTDTRNSEPSASPATSHPLDRELLAVLEE
jgi:hypothetical protein